MKQSFLNKLAGLHVNVAEQIVQQEGYKIFAIDKDMLITSIARPNTVILWLDKGIVSSAQAGDPVQLVP